MSRMTMFDYGCFGYYCLQVILVYYLSGHTSIARIQRAITAVADNHRLENKHNK